MSGIRQPPFYVPLVYSAILFIATASGELGFARAFLSAAAAAQKNEHQGEQRTATADFIDNIAYTTVSAAAYDKKYDKQPEVAVVVGKSETVHHNIFLLYIK